MVYAVVYTMSLKPLANVSWWREIEWNEEILLHTFSARKGRIKIHQNTHTLSLTHTHSLSHTHTLSHTHIQTLTRTLSHTNIHTLIHTSTNTHTHTHTQLQLHDS